jgi:Winged helix DNA-binding domain
MQPSPTQIYAARAQRQFLTPSTRGSSDADYLEILRSLAPMRPCPYAFPGTPVCLDDRHEPSDGASSQTVAERVRRAGLVVKARFQHGNVGYVPTEEMPLFIAAFRKTKTLGWDETLVLETLMREGPLQKKDLAEMSGIKSKALSKALQNLQAGFQVLEQQLETEWDNPWFAVESEYPDWLTHLPEAVEARLAVVLRFCQAHVFSSAQEVKDWSGFAVKDVGAILETLCQRQKLLQAEVEGWGAGYLTADFADVPLEPCVAVLDLGDPLVTAQASTLKAAFADKPILKYILINGEICGAVEGRWGIAPFDIDDVHVPPEAQKGAMRLEIIEKIQRHFPPPKQRILKFAGKPLKL